MKVYINAHNPASEGAKELAHHLGALRIKPENSKFKGGANKLVINWGSRHASGEVMNSKILNPPNKVAICADKLKFFETIEAHNRQQETFETLINIPAWTTSQKTAMSWAIQAKTIVCRTILNGHSGEGIILYTPEDNLRGMLIPIAPLYTKYVPKKSEYRVHVMSGEVIDIQRKARNGDIPDDQVNWKIRNHGNGFIYARNDGLGNVPADVTKQALLAIKAVGLDFGAVDIIYNEGKDAAYVLEINTAPGLAGQTGEIYAGAIKKYYGV